MSRIAEGIIFRLRYAKTVDTTPGDGNPCKNHVPPYTSTSQHVVPALAEAFSVLFEQSKQKRGNVSPEEVLNSEKLVGTRRLD